MDNVFSAPYYKISLNFEISESTYYSWSRMHDRTGLFKEPYLDGDWIPRRDIAFETGGMWSESAVKDGGTLTPNTVHELLKLHCVVTTDANVKRDVIGEFSAVLDQMPLLCGKLKNALSNSFPQVFEFIELPEVWNGAFQCLLPGGPYFLTNLLTRVDSWDKERTKFYEFAREDGSKYTQTSQTQLYVDGRLASKFPIWRDSLTADVVCTERFREVAQAAGCKEWEFREIPTSAQAK